MHVCNEGMGRSSEVLHTSMSPEHVAVHQFPARFFFDHRAILGLLLTHVPAAKHTIPVCQQQQDACMSLKASGFLSVHTNRKMLLFLRPKRALEGLAQPQACRAGDSFAGGAATRLRQARPLSACIRICAIR
jgi:hypothetical protein